MDVDLAGDALRLSGGVFTAALHHLTGDSFLVLPNVDPVVETFSFIRDSNGTIVGFMWDDDRYDRIRS